MAPGGFLPRGAEGLLRRHHRSILLAAALLSLALLPGLARLKSDNSPSIFFVRDSERFESYLTLREQFGSDEAVRVVVEGRALWTEDGFRWQHRLTENLAALSGVETVFSLSRFLDLDTGPGVLRDQAVNHGLARDLGLVSKDGLTTGLLVLFAPGEPATRRASLELLQTQIMELPAGLEASLVGLPVLNQALDRSSQEIGSRFFPLLVLFTLLLLSCCLRHPSGVLVPLAFVAFCELLVLSLMGYLGVHLNLVLSILPPVLFVIALATALHLVLHFRACHETLDPVSACLETYRQKGWSVFWTGLTTSIGFGSLAFSSVAPVQLLGRFAALGLVLSTLAALTVLPALFVAFPPPPHRNFEQGLRRQGRVWAWRAIRHSRVVLVAAALLAGLALLGLPRVRIETNALRYLEESHPVRAGLERLEAKGIGSATVEILLSGRSFSTAEDIQELALFSDHLADHPGIFAVVGPGSLLRESLSRIPGLVPGEERRRFLAWQGLQGSPEGRQALASMLSTDQELARLTVSVPTLDLEELESLLSWIRRQQEDLLPGTQIKITGTFPLLLEAQKHLLSTLWSSLALTLLGVLVVLRILLPGSRLTLLALLPNLCPVLGALGFMGWVGLPLDIATVMVAAVVLSLAVDDTLHTLGHFRQLGPRVGARRAMVRTLTLTAPAYLLTGIILVAGFGVCALSDFAPTARFGLVSAFAIGLAVLGDLFLLPTLLGFTPGKSIRRWSRPSS